MRIFLAKSRSVTSTPRHKKKRSFFMCSYDAGEGNPHPSLLTASSQPPHSLLTASSQPPHRPLTASSQPPHSLLTAPSQPPHSPLTASPHPPHSPLTASSQPPRSLHGRHPLPYLRHCSTPSRARRPFSMQNSNEKLTPWQKLERESHSN